MDVRDEREPAVRHEMPVPGAWQPTGGCMLRASSALLLASAAALTGCSDDADSCGPGDAPASGLVASGEAVTLTYGQLTAGRNNDCNAADAPAGVISLSIHGTQSDGSGLITLCVARPDLLASTPQALGPNDASAAVRVIDLAGSASGCSFTIDRSRAPTGTASASGLCGNGSDPAGFALSVDGAVSLTRTCGAAVDSVQVTLRGRVAVAPQ